MNEANAGLVAQAAQVRPASSHNAAELAMSNDKYLGVSCLCVPRRYFALALATAFLAYGMVSLVRALILGQWPGEAGLASWQVDGRCVGHRCQDVLTCRGTRKATFYTREIILVLGSTVFGYWGVLGALRYQVEELRWFAFFLVGVAVLLGALLVSDGFYSLICQAYPLNVVDEAILWELPHVPVREAIKRELKDAIVAYPVTFVNRLTQLNVFVVYLLVELPIALFYAYASNQVLIVAQYMSYGPQGLGANYDIRDWREHVLLKRGLDKVSYQGVVRGAGMGQRPGV